MGLGLTHGQGHLLRAVTEGLALELGRHLRLLQGSRLPLQRLAMCGGATESRLTSQIVTDVAGVPVAAVAETEVSALGAAMIARGLVETGAGLARIVEEMRPSAYVYRPGRNAAVYRDMLDEYVAAVSR